MSSHSSRDACNSACSCVALKRLHHLGRHAPKLSGTLPRPQSDPTVSTNEQKTAASPAGAVQAPIYARSVSSALPATARVTKREMQTVSRDTGHAHPLSWKSRQPTQPRMSACRGQLRLALPPSSHPQPAVMVPAHCQRTVVPRESRIRRVRRRSHAEKH